MGNFCLFQKRPPSKSHSPALALERSLLVNQNQRFLSQYQLKELLGEGTFGKVFRVHHSKLGLQRAAKVIKRDSGGEIQLLQIINQYKILKTLDHPNIVKVKQIYVDSQQIYIVTELLTGGQLLRKLLHNKIHTQTLRLLIKNVASALHYCHSNKVCHRDIKPQNLIFQNQTECKIKIVDFGYSRHFSKSSSLKQTVGTFQFIAPQVIKKQYNQKCDIWSLGVILYLIVSGELPFSAKNQKQLLKCIKQTDIKSKLKKLKLSIQLTDLLTAMLETDPASRISAFQILNHPWLLSIRKSSFSISQASIKSLQKFYRSSKLSNLISVLISEQFISKDQVHRWQQIFKILDLDGDGKISFLQIESFLVNKRAQFTQLVFLRQIITQRPNHFIKCSQFVAAMVQKKALLSSELGFKIFNWLDLNKDGRIQLKQLKLFLPSVSEGKVMQLIDEIDIDGDGMISYCEWSSMLHKLTM